MITSVFIIAISVILFVYWLRYSCVMLLRNAQERTEVSTVADERFSISSVRERLKTEGDLDSLERALERDYHVVTYLIEHAADLELASIENKLLVIDYKLMRALVAPDADSGAGTIPQGAVRDGFGAQRPGGPDERAEPFSDGSLKEPRCNRIFQFV